MSKYKIVQTEYRSLDSLKKALGDVLGPDAELEIARDPRCPSLPLYGYVGDQRAERASLRLPRQVVNLFSGGWSNDIGFTWDGRCYQAIVSDYDQGNAGSQRLLAQVKQRYALHELRRQAKLKGYTVREHPAQDGTIRLTLTHR
jgi:hypothetical protein